jgi:hypothetical protein
MSKIDATITLEKTIELDIKDECFTDQFLDEFERGIL